jgi:two-component system OmpR family response regulator
MPDGRDVNDSPTPIRCLLVSADPWVRSHLRSFLDGFDMSVTSVATPAALRGPVGTHLYDIVVLDAVLADGSALAVCRHVHATTRLPLIYLAADQAQGSGIRALDLGADDYVERPLRPRELVARIRAVLRRQQLSPHAGAAPLAPVCFAGWTFDRAMHELTSPAGRRVPLANAEFRLLCAFVAEPHEVLSREHLIEMTRAPDVDISERRIDLVVSRLRQKLGDSPGRATLVCTVRGEGYRFDADVRACGQA